MTELNARIDAYLAANYVEPLRSAAEPRSAKPLKSAIFKKAKRADFACGKNAVPKACEDEDAVIEASAMETPLMDAPCEAQAMQAGSAQTPPPFMGQAPQMFMVQAMEAAPAQDVKKRSLEEVISEVSETWQESLFRLIDEKGYADTEVYKRAGVDRKLFSKIRSNSDYRPKKNTAIAFALALKLNLDETKDFLMRAGYALSKSSRFDLIIEFFIENEVYDLMTIDMALYDHNEQALSS